MKCSECENESNYLISEDLEELGIENDLDTGICINCRNKIRLKEPIKVPILNIKNRGEIDEN